MRKQKFADGKGARLIKSVAKVGLSLELLVLAQKEPIVMAIIKIFIKRRD